MNERAFPTYHGGYAKCDADGMTLRDYFAAKAMNGILESAIDWFPTHKTPDQETLDLFADLAQDSYAIADAMLKARQQ